MNRRQITALLALCSVAVMPASAVQPEQQGQADPAAPGAAPGSDLAGVDQAALERLRQAAETIKAAPAISYRLRTTATGLLASGTPAVEFQVKLVRQGSGWKVRVSGEGKRRPAEEPQQVDAVFTDAQITWVDYAARTVSTKPIRTARGSTLQLVFAARLTELLAAEPFGRELAAGEIASLGQEEVDGTLCDIIAVRTRPKSSRTKWWISQADNFPRRVEKGIESASRGGSSTVELTGVQIGSPIPPEEFEVPTPEGFTRVDEGEQDPRPGTQIQQPATPAPTPPSDAPPTGEEDVSSDPVPAPDRPQPPPTVEPSAAPTPLDVVLVDHKGVKVPLASLRGRPVVLVFVASWSLPSREAVVQAQSLAAYCGDSVPLLGAGVRERYPDRFAEFVTGNNGAFRVFPVGDPAAKELGVKVVPAVVLLDDQGVPRHTFEGIKPEQWKELPAMIERLGGPPAPAPAPSTPAADETPAPAQPPP